MDAVFATRALADELMDSTLRAGKTIRLTISTRSMLPTFAPGDRILARGILPGDPRVGAVAVMRVGERWLAHRVIARRSVNGVNFWTTQGDNSPDPDDPWSSEQICAMINAVERNGRIANLESNRAQVGGALIAALSRSRSQVGRAHRGIQSILGLAVRASARVTEWIIGYK